MSVRIDRRLWPRNQKDLLVAEFGDTHKVALSNLVSALDRLERTGTPGSEEPCKPPLRQFYRSIDELTGIWLWVYFGETQHAVQPYIVVGIVRIDTAPGVMSPPTPPDSAWRSALDLFRKPIPNT
jgi:hypothetical protein